MFSSCSSVYADPTKQNKPHRQISLATENLMLFVAMDYEARGGIINSSKLLLQLYENSKIPEYATEYLISLNKSQKYKALISEFSRLELSGDENLREFAKALYLNGDIEKSEIEAFKIKKKIEDDYKFLAIVKYKYNDYISGIDYLKLGYKLNKTPDFIELQAEFLIKLNLIDEAVDVLETYQKSEGFNLEIFELLGDIYRQNNIHAKALIIYKELYSKTKNREYQFFIFESLKSLSKIKELILFLEKNNYDNDFLLKLYMSQKLFKKGLDLSKKLYDINHNKELLLQYYIFEYEFNLSENKSKQNIISLITKIENIIKDGNSSMYFNYLGYSMVDNNYKVSDGVNYIKEALKIEPNSFYILDSLAWGEYKLGNCKKALEIMSKVIKNIGLNDSEINKHWIEINSCKEKK